MPFKIIIVGCGVAGLAAAIALAKKGHKVTILEATSKLQPIGGSIVMQANANRVLDDLGIYEELLKICAWIPFGPSTRRYKDGEFLIKKSVELHQKDFGFPLWSVHRADLQEIMVEAAIKHGAELRLGCPVIAVVENQENATVIIQGYERIKADVVVGADGINSTIRRSIVHDSESIRDSGLDITRLTIPGNTVRGDPLTSVFMEQMGLWIGPSTTLVVMPIRRGDQWLLGLDCCHPRDETSVEGVGQSQNIENFREHYKDFAPAIQKLLSYVEEGQVWMLVETVPKSWVSEHGRVVLIGDAAHATLPWLGQGGGLALEDAPILARCLQQADTHGIPTALNVFESIRQPRCARLQEWAAWKGRRATLLDGPEQIERDKQLKFFNAWVRGKSLSATGSEKHPEFQTPDWMSGYDAIEFANEELEKIL